MQNFLVSDFLSFAFLILLSHHSLAPVKQLSVKAAVGDAWVCLPSVSHALSTSCGDPARNDSRIDSPGSPARAFSSGIGTGIIMTVIKPGLERWLSG